MKGHDLRHRNTNDPMPCQTAVARARLGHEFQENVQYSDKGGSAINIRGHASVSHDNGTGACARRLWLQVHSLGMATSGAAVP